MARVSGSGSRTPTNFSGSPYPFPPPPRVKRFIVENTCFCPEDDTRKQALYTREVGQVSAFFSCWKRSLFFCVRCADEYGKGDLCHWSKFTVLSMRGGYLATESSRDTLCCVVSLKVIPWFCIAHSYCARFLRHQHAHMSARAYKT